MRKDFVVSPLQIFEARELGASTILLIAAVLNEKRVLAEYINIARGVGFEPLVETHNEKEIELALSADAKIIGINNRNLHDFTEDIYTTVRLRELVPKDKVIISDFVPSNPEHRCQNGKLYECTDEWRYYPVPVLEHHAPGCRQTCCYR